jgi:sarcosine oxidase, subunit gamma
MSAPALKLCKQRERAGLKGPRAPEWLAAQGIVLPAVPNTWAHSDTLLVARLGQLEFFLEGTVAGAALKRISTSLDQRPAGVYPVPREDWGFLLGGDRVHDVLAQVCNVNFAALPLHSHPVVMTLMIGVAVLVVPQGLEAGQGGAGERQYRIWCDPTYGAYLGDSLGAVVVECGGRYTGVSG